MKSQVLSMFPMAWLSCVGLIIFLLVFISAVFWAFRKQSHKLYQYMETLPLGEDR